MSTNILNTTSNFCIGPQSGTFCTVDYTSNPPIMHVKNSSGVIIRTYGFSPSSVLYPSPYTSGDYQFVSIKYIGPTNQDSYYDGAVFYTLEVADDKNIELRSGDILNYNKNVIRRWRLDASNFVLILETSYYKDSDDTYFFNSRAFSVQHINDVLNNNLATGSSIINIASADKLVKYDKVLIGPSSDVTNIGAVEEAYVHSVDGNNVTLRTYSGYVPTKYEYISGDPVTIFKDIYLFSNPEQALDDRGAAVGNLEPYGNLYVISEYSYGQVISTDTSALYCDVIATDWNSYFECLSFVKCNTLIHMGVIDYVPIKSQVLKNTAKDRLEILPVYDLAILGPDVYKLQKKVSKISAGVDILETWTTYNYVLDSLVPYTSCVNSSLVNTIISAQSSTDLVITVRDQFGVTLINKNVFVEVTDNSGTTLYPNEDLVTDVNGICTIQCTANGIFEGIAEVETKVDGGATANGNEYVYHYTKININKLFLSSCILFNVVDLYITDYNIVSNVLTLEQDVGVPCHVRLDNPGGQWLWNGNEELELDNPTVEDRNAPPDTEAGGILSCVYQPMFNSIETDYKGDPYNLNEFVHLPFAPITQYYGLNDEHELSIKTYLEISDVLPMSQNFVSRHLNYGHIVTSDLSQYVFIQEALPAFWSEKNLPLVDYWIRLRPFAYSLNLDTLLIEVYEESYLGISDTVTISDYGVKENFDAGSGMTGIDFSYTFPTYFHNSAVVYVKVQVYDTAPTPNLLEVNYWFKIIPDYKAPYIEAISPDINSTDVKIDTAITFDIKDIGEGVDIDTLFIYINDRQVSSDSVEYTSGNYHVTCILDAHFHYGETVSIFVQVSDRSDNKNTLRYGWKFWCVGSEGPWFDEDSITPGKCIPGIGASDADIGIQVYAVGGTGIDRDSIKLSVGSKYSDTVITPIIYRIE